MDGTRVETLIITENSSRVFTKKLSKSSTPNEWKLENYIYIYIYYTLTASRFSLWRRQLAAKIKFVLPRSTSDAVMCKFTLGRHMYFDPYSLGDAVRPNSLENTLGRHVYFPHPPILPLLTSSLALPWRRQILFPARILRLCRFLHFFAPKTFKMLHFPDFSSKVPKITKETI